MRPSDTIRSTHHDGAKSGGRVDQRCLTVPQAAAYLSISRGQLYQLIGRSEIGSITIGRSRRIPISALEDYVVRRLHEGT